jgi:hypothetical protein
VSDLGFLAFDFKAPSRLIYPVLSQWTPLAVEEWAWRELRNAKTGKRGWSIARRHAQLVHDRTCHYDKRRKDDLGDVHSGHLHCFCRKHEQGKEYGMMPRVMGLRPMPLTPQVPL